MHQDDFVVYVTHLLAETLTDLGVQILSTFASSHPSGNVLAVREEAQEALWAQAEVRQGLWYSTPPST